MFDVITQMRQNFSDQYSGTTVGAGGTFSGSGVCSLSGTAYGPYPIALNLNNNENIIDEYPCINFLPVQNENLGREVSHTTGGRLSRTWVSIKVVVKRDVHGQSVLGILTDEVYQFLQATRLTPSGTAKEVYMESVDVSYSLSEPEFISSNLLCLMPHYF